MRRFTTFGIQNFAHWPFPYTTSFLRARRAFQTNARLAVVKPFLLADIGEGITECQLIQWFVQPGARVEQFDKLCEVQSDKASVEITSPYDGVIKKLHYDPDEMAITGKPLVDIDIEDIPDQTEDSTSLIDVKETYHTAGGKDDMMAKTEGIESPDSPALDARDTIKQSPKSLDTPAETASSLATPAVRHLLRQYNVDITTLKGTGRDGRVMKHDVYQHISEKQNRKYAESPGLQDDSTIASSQEQANREVQLSRTGLQMFKVMTRSTNIPHFLFSNSADMTKISQMRENLNSTASKTLKLTHFAFLLKAVSMALIDHPLLNASLSESEHGTPKLVYQQSHNIGVAVDTPNGLVVPVINRIQELSISAIADRLRHLAEDARSNKLTPKQLSGATFTVSNIGSIGGGVVAPIVSVPQVAILGVGRTKIVPAFDNHGDIIKKEEMTLSWSADHRVIDGAECARCAEKVVKYLENPESMMVMMH